MTTKKKRPTIEDITPEKADRLQQVLEGDIAQKILKRFGKNMIMRGSAHKDPTGKIPTGIFPLDYALEGGLSAGKVTIFYGAKSASKTSTALRAIASAQERCASCWMPVISPVTGELIECGCGQYREPVIAFVNTESDWDKAWATRLGVDVDKVLYSHPDYGEQAIDICDTLLRSGDVDVMLLDSIAFLIPATEVENSAEKALMGVQPRMIGNGVRKFNSALNFCNREYGRVPTLIMTNQIRYKLGVMFGNPETTPGGQAPGYVATTEIKCSSGPAKYDKETNEPLTVEMKFRVTKNKAGTAYREGEYLLVVTPHGGKRKGDIVDEPFVMSMAERFGLIVRDGAKWICMDEEFKKKELIEDKILSDLSFTNTLKSRIMEIGKAQTDEG